MSGNTANQRPAPNEPTKIAEVLVGVAEVAAFRDEAIATNASLNPAHATT